MLSSMTPWRCDAFCIPSEIWISCQMANRSIMITRMGIFLSDLFIVAPLAQCLSVEPVPEKLRVYSDLTSNLQLPEMTTHS